MVHIENEGAVFRGPSRAWPKEVWNARARKWEVYKGETPKPIEWGNVIDEAEANRLIGDGDEPKAEAA